MNTIVGCVVYEASGMAARNTFWPSEFVFVFLIIFVFVFVFVMVKIKRY